MRTPYLSIATMLGSVIVLIPGNALLNTLVPLRAKLEDFPSVTIGVLGSVYFGAMLLGTLVSPAIIKRLGYVRSFALFATATAAVAVALPLLLDPAAWLVLRALVGFSVAGLFAITDGWVQGKADNTNRGRLGAAYQSVHFIGSAAGQALIILADPRTPTLFMLGAALQLLAILPLALSSTAPPARPKTVNPEFLWLLRNAPVAAIGSLAVGAANGSFWSLFPVFGVTTGLNNGQISAFLTATVIGSALAIWPLGRLSDRMDRRIVMAGQMLLAAAFEFVLAFFGAALGWGIGLFGFLIGCASMTIYSIAISHANDRTDSAKSVAIASALLFFYCAGAIAGPVVAVSLMERVGPQALFLFMGSVHAAALAFTLLRILQRAPAPVQTEADAKLPPP